jgi:hypothetical protein
MPRRPADPGPAGVRRHPATRQWTNSGHRITDIAYRPGAAPAARGAGRGRGTRPAPPYAFTTVASSRRVSILCIGPEQLHYQAK